jgi:hypothetical protein
VIRTAAVGRGNVHWCATFVGTQSAATEIVGDGSFNGSSCRVHFNTSASTAAGFRNRQIGPLAAVKVSPDGRVLAESQWQGKIRDWLPTAEDREYVQSAMGRVVEPGKFANWISPQTVDCEYVRFN